MQPRVGDPGADLGAPIGRHSIVTHSALPRCC
jgi:hypothetical protein